MSFDTTTTPYLTEWQGPRASTGTARGQGGGDRVGRQAHACHEPSHREADQTHWQADRERDREKENQTNRQVARGSLGKQLLAT